MGPGKYRHQMRWERAEEGQGAAGGELPIWGLKAYVWCQVRPQGSGEVSGDRMEAARIGETMFRVTTRAIPGLRPEVGDRLVWGARTLDVDGVVDEDEQGRTWRIDAREVQRGTVAG